MARETDQEIIEVPFKRRTDAREKEGFTKMASMAICANLYNGSPGRDPEHVARFAVHAAHCLWKEWIKAKYDG